MTLRTIPRISTSVAAVAPLALGCLALGLSSLGSPAGADIEGASEGESAFPIQVVKGVVGAQDEPQGNAAPRPFVTHQTCALCHLGAPDAKALRDTDGYDVSPVRLWKGTMMANAFRDPYWRAQLAHEVETHPDQAEELHSLCTRCHAPMAWRADELAQAPHRSPRELEGDALARDGVSCSLCHQIAPDALGEASTFDGLFELRDEAIIYGPYERPFAMPMRRFSGYTPTHGPHVRESALCGSCHTLLLEHDDVDEAARVFPEQSPYLEWRNSVFSTEADGAGSTAVEPNAIGSQPLSCQECHMADLGPMRIARNPAGRDFPPVRERPDVRGHAFVGGNAWMLDLLREEAVQFDALDRVAELALGAAATRRQLSFKTAQLEIVGSERRSTSAEIDEVRVDVLVTNLAGHKLPSAYPSRRAWLFFEAKRGADVLLRVGAVDEAGRLVGVDDELALPHVDEVRGLAQVPVYEAVGEDAQGRVTTSLVDLRRWRKDTRLLPRGWRADGPDAGLTGPYGLNGDDDMALGGDFRGGSDVVTFVLEEAPGGEARGPLQVRAELRYQSIPPAWVDGLRSSKTEEAKTFLELFDARGAGFEVLARIELEIGG